MYFKFYNTVRVEKKLKALSTKKFEKLAQYYPKA
jgi:hypothetical protein